MSVRRWPLSWPVVALAVAAACGDSSTAPATPAAVVVVSGNLQVGPVGDQLLEPLRVVVFGTDGLPYVGGSIAWAVTVGAAALTPPTSVTDSSGEATTVVTPTAAGPLTVTASIGMVTPVSFAATAVPPCDYTRPYSLGDTVGGVLTTLDCGLNLSGATFYYDFYQLDFASQQSFSVGMSSSTFDTWLDIFRDTGALLGVNDDSLQLVLNSYFEGIFAAGSYVIGASTFEPVTTGPYTVRSATRPATISECRVIWGTPAITVSETIELTDCLDQSTGSDYYSDRMVLTLEAGATLEVHMTSGDVDPYLYLVDIATATIVASNDDSTLGNPNAYFTYVVPQDGFYFIDVGTSLAGQTGTYTLTIGPAAITAGAAAPRWRLAPMRADRATGGKAPITIRTPLRSQLGTAGKDPTP